MSSLNWFMLAYFQRITELCFNLIISWFCRYIYVPTAYCISLFYCQSRTACNQLTHLIVADVRTVRWKYDCSSGWCDIIRKTISPLSDNICHNFDRLFCLHSYIVGWLVGSKKNATTSDIWNFLNVLLQALFNLYQIIVIFVTSKPDIIFYITMLWRIAKCGCITERRWANIQYRMNKIMHSIMCLGLQVRY